MSVEEQRERALAAEPLRFGHTISEDRERAFQTHLQRTTNYFAAIRDAGDLPWFAVGHPRRAKLLERLGLPEGISEEDLRRAFFMERYR